MPDIWDARNPSHLARLAASSVGAALGDVEELVDLLRALGDDATEARELSQALEALHGRLLAEARRVAQHDAEARRRRIESNERANAERVAREKAETLALLAKMVTPSK